MTSEVIRVKTDPGPLSLYPTVGRSVSPMLRRVHTFSSEMYEQLVSQRDALKTQLEAHQQLHPDQVEEASQLVCGTIRRSTSVSEIGGESATAMPPRHPWDHKPLGQKSSLPPKLGPHLLPPPPIVCTPQQMSRSPPPPTLNSLPPHPGISRTLSDSFGKPNLGLGLSSLSANLSSASGTSGSRRKLESEDSSYDSDHDSHHDLLGFGLSQHLHVSKSHDDVSRTPSETLAAEFSEHVTLREKSPTGSRIGNQSPIEVDQIMSAPGYAAKVEFALRLGYTEALLQKALLKLGPGAAENQILEELIRLQKYKPLNLDHTSSCPAPGTVPVATPLITASGSASNLPLIVGDLGLNEQSDRSASKSTGSSDLLPIVIDGSNVAMSHGNKDIFSCKGILLCVQWFQQRGHEEITVFVPKWRKETPRPETPIKDKQILLDLERQRLLSFTPSRQVLGKRFVCHDDRYILNYAADTGAIVVSNDNYRDLINEKPTYKKVIKERILMFSFVNDRFMPPDDPMGRSGPTLDQFLRRSYHGLATTTGSNGTSTCDSTTSSSAVSTSVAQQQQPCPYGKKCTYGNKCKYFHADRVKSVSDKLKENYSLRKIHEIRVRAGHQGPRGHQGQAYHAHHNSLPGKDISPGDALTRTRSLQTPAEGPYCWDKESLCRTHSTVPDLSNARSSQEPSHWSSLGMLVPTSMPDTSLPPPPPRGPWASPRQQQGAQQHRKLARQLTINPAFDPRIHPLHQPLMAQQQQQPPPQPAVQQPQGLFTLRTDMPPPNMHHDHVTRNASAPEQSYNPEAQLHKTLSDVSGCWDSSPSRMVNSSSPPQHAPPAGTLSSSPLPLTGAVSPLIGNSNGVWEAGTVAAPRPTTPRSNADTTEEARSKFYYHLAAMFPEEQVLRALRALPDETNPQKICSYILSLNEKPSGK